MKKINANKKGFTIVELVIVIAVIGILAAILIPTFINLNNKAQAAANKSFVSEINKQLAINDALEEGNKDKFPTNNLYQVKKFLDDEKGFDVTKLSPVDGNELVWDQEANKFALIDKDNNIVFADFDVTNANHHRWLIVKDGSELVSAPAVSSRKGLKTKETASLLSLGYSVYLADNSFSGSIVLKAGFDAGENESIKKITYDVQAVQDDVIIRTFGGTLNLSGNNDVTHYGNGTKLNLDTTATYTERGDWDKSKLISGDMVVEEGSSLGVADVTEATANLTIVVKDENAIKDLVVDEANENFEVPEQLEEKKVTKTYVANETELNNALADPEAKYIAFTDDIDQENIVFISRNVIIDGQNHTLKSVKAAANRSIRIDTNNVEVQIKDLIIDGNNISQRAVQLDSSKNNVSISLDNIVTKNITYYAINVCNYCENTSLKIVDSDITGWGAVNLWSVSYTVYIANSVLTGHNDKGYDKKGWNDFGTLILEGDTTGETDEHSSDIDVKLINTTVKATTTGQGNKQFCVLFNSPSTHNNVYAENCTFVYNESENTYLLLGENATNHLYINGELVD